MGLLGAIGSVLGGISKNKMLKKQEDMINDQKKANKNWYDMRYNEDATQRADAQEVLSKTEEAIKQRNKQSEGRAAVMGGNESSIAASKEANAQAMAGAAGAIAQNGERRKDAIEQQYLKKNDAYNKELREIQSDKQGLLDIASGAIGAYSEEDFLDKIILAKKNAQDEAE